jgi:hypothetical protein
MRGGVRGRQSAMSLMAGLAIEVDQWAGNPNWSCSGRRGGCLHRSAGQLQWQPLLGGKDGGYNGGGGDADNGVDHCDKDEDVHLGNLRMGRVRILFPVEEEEGGMGNNDQGVDDWVGGGEKIFGISLGGVLDLRNPKAYY